MVLNRTPWRPKPALPAYRVGFPRLRAGTGSRIIRLRPGRNGIKKSKSGGLRSRALAKARQ